MQRHVQSQEPEPSVGNRVLSIEIKNFGPISKGKINLKPLTILVGPNGCGKSHATTLFYIMAQIEQFYNDQYIRSLRDAANKHDVMQKESDRIYKQHMDGASVVKTDILLNHIDPSTVLKRATEESFAAGAKTLIRLGKSSATLHISSQLYDNIKIRLNSNNIRVDGFTKPEIQINFIDLSDMDTAPHDNTTEQEMLNVDIPFDCGVSDIYDALQRKLGELPRRQKRDVCYFPAERMGLSLASRSITAGYLYIRGDPKMPRTTIDYLALLIHSPPEEGDFADMAREAEKKIIRGEIFAKTAPESDYGPPNIYYKSDGYQFPLHRAASSAKDLASFFLYLKYFAEVGDLVILEEPEINLHPTAQIHLARFIARLINKGLYVMASTHSPYFLEQISHCVKAGHTDNKGVNDILPKEERIRPDDVAPYKFVPHGSGYEIRDIPVSTEGIPQEEFLDVDEVLYDELLKLRRLEHE